MISARKVQKQGGTLPYKKDVYQRFIEWAAMDSEERKKAGFPTGRSFAEEYGVNEKTLVRWQSRSDFLDKKRQAQILKLQLETSDVLTGLKNRCKKYGMAYDVELFLLYVENWDRKHIIELLGEVKLADTDLRSVIGLLPEHKQQKFYEVLAELVADAEHARNQQQQETSV